MDLRKWSSSNLKYGKKIVSSGLDGARSGREAFLQGRSFTPFLSESVQNAWKPAVVAASIGVLSSIPGNRHKSMSKTLACGIAGAVVGFGVALAWQNRGLTASMTNGALRNIGKVCDEHRFECHPIDYA